MGNEVSSPQGGENGDRTGTPTGSVGKGNFQTMNKNLQHKFKKGIQYNMKVVIRGDKNVGKTCLLSRLQGLQFMEEYIPTPEIQAATIKWNYKATDDVVKVEVWDVVDVATKKKSRTSLKLANDSIRKENGEEGEMGGADASVIDVYQGVNGAIFVVDITKPWSFDYCKREIEKVPKDISVLVLANKRDLEHERKVQVEEIRMWAQLIHDGRDLHFAEASMKDGYGLSFLYSYLSLPFLKLQRQSLLKQLETNKYELESVKREIENHDKSKHQNYEAFLTLKSGSGTVGENEELKEHKENSNNILDAYRNNDNPRTEQATISVPETKDNTDIDTNNQENVPEVYNGFYSDDSEPEILQQILQASTMEASDSEDDVPNPMVRNEIDFNDNDAIHVKTQNKRTSKKNEQKKKAKFRKDETQGVDVPPPSTQSQIQVETDTVPSREQEMSKKQSKQPNAELQKKQEQKIMREKKQQVVNSFVPVESEKELAGFFSDDDANVDQLTGLVEYKVDYSDDDDEGVNPLVTILGDDDDDDDDDDVDDNKDHFKDCNDKDGSGINEFNFPTGINLDNAMNDTYDVNVQSLTVINNVDTGATYVNFQNDYANELDQLKNEYQSIDGTSENLDVSAYSQLGGDYSERKSRRKKHKNRNDDEEKNADGELKKRRRAKRRDKDREKNNDNNNDNNEDRQKRRERRREGQEKSGKERAKKKPNRENS